MLKSSSEVRIWDHLHTNYNGKLIFLQNSNASRNNVQLSWKQIISCAGTPSIEIGTAKQNKGIYADVTDSGLLLEMLTSEIGTYSIRIGKSKPRQRMEKERRVFAEFNKCESEMCTNPQDENIERYQILKESIDEMQTEKGKKAMLWSGIRWMD